MQPVYTPHGDSYYRVGSVGSQEQARLVLQAHLRRPVFGMAKETRFNPRDGANIEGWFEEMRKEGVA